MLCYQADVVNYAPGGQNAVVPQYSESPLPGAPEGTFPLVEASANARRIGWYRPHCKVYLDTNLRNLGDWPDVTDFTAAKPYMKPEDKAKIKRLNANLTSKADVDRVTHFEQVQKHYGRVMKSRQPDGAKAENLKRVDAEKTRKSNWLKERCNYGINGMYGLGDSHFEYDTVINQMLYQMYLWGFRKKRPLQFSQLQLNQHVQDRTVPAEYLYDLIATLALDAHQRRVANAQIADGTNSPISRPPVMNNVVNQ
jgi:hypothetical protein